jgi:hypothetical protein
MSRSIALATDAVGVAVEPMRIRVRNIPQYGEAPRVDVAAIEVCRSDRDANVRI